MAKRGERSASPGKRSAAAAPKAPRDLSEALNGAFSYLVRARGAAGGVLACN
jgi:hypothetical protein